MSNEYVNQEGPVVPNLRLLATTKNSRKVRSILKWTMNGSLIYDDDGDVDDGHVHDLNLEVDHEGLPHVDVSRVRVGFV